MNTAQKERERKERNPECFCPAPWCLWRTNGEHCPRHEQEINQAAHKQAIDATKETK